MPIVVTGLGPFGEFSSAGSNDGLISKHKCGVYSSLHKPTPRFWTDRHIFHSNRASNIASYWLGGVVQSGLKLAGQWASIDDQTSRNMHIRAVERPFDAH